MDSLGNRFARAVAHGAVGGTASVLQGSSLVMGLSVPSIQKWRPVQYH